MVNKALSPQGSHISTGAIVQSFSQSQQRHARIIDHDNSILKLQWNKQELQEQRKTMNNNLNEQWLLDNTHDNAYQKTALKPVMVAHATVQ